MTVRYKRNRRRDDAHVDDWLMTYADMITLLLCFFAILLAVSVPRHDKMTEATVQIQKTFAATDKHGRFAVKPNGLDGGEPGKSLDYLPSIVDKYDMPKPVPVPPQQPAQKPAGDRLTMVDLNSATFFPSGSAMLTDDGKKALAQALQNLNTAQYKDYTITVDGYTDDNPIATAQFPSNWELSSARAAAVVRFFISQGVPADKLRAEGYADTHPKMPNRDVGGNVIPANQAQNRRVVIQLEKLDKGGQ